MRPVFRGLSLLLAAAMLAAPSARAQNAGPGMAHMSAADQAALRSYHLTMDNVSQAAAATQDLDQLQKSDPAVRAAGKNSNTKTLSDAVDKLNSFPAVRAILAKHNLSARDYLMTMLSAMYAGIGYTAQQQGSGAYAAMVAQLPTNPDNVQFFAAHQADIQKLKGTSDGESPKP